MTRFTLFTVLMGFAPARADDDIAPPPREVPAAVREPIPQLAQVRSLRTLQAELCERTAAFHAAHPDRAKWSPEQADELRELEATQREVGELFAQLAPQFAGHGPATETVGRIVTNAAGAGDRLAAADPGADTQATQAAILKDIDSLLEPPPAQGGNDKTDAPKPPTNADPKPKESDPKSGMGDPPPKPDADPMSKPGTAPMPKPQTAPQPDPKPMPGTQGADPKPTPKPGGTDPKPQPDPKPQGTNPKPPEATDPKPPDDKKGAGGGVPPNAAAQPGSAVPLDEDVAKKVWGGPREQMRKQVDQYYTERFMPGYSTLLRGYYSHLATGGKK